MDDERREKPKLPERKSLTDNGAGDDESKWSEHIVALRDGAGDSRQRRAVAAFSYECQKEDELPLQVGDIVDVLGEVESEWWLGRLNGRIGVFPSPFVNSLDEETKTDDMRVGDGDAVEKPADGESNEKVIGAANKDNQRKDSPGNLTAVNGDMNAIIVSEVESLGAPKPDDQKVDTMLLTSAANLSITESLSPKVPVTKIDSRSEQQNVPLLSHSSMKPKELAKVIRAYAAEKEGQLSLQVGDVVTVLSKNVDSAKDLWLGEMNNKRGTFPSTCVTAGGADDIEKPLVKTAFATAAPPPLPVKPPKLKPVISAPSPESTKRAEPEIKIEDADVKKKVVFSKSVEKKDEKSMSTSISPPSPPGSSSISSSSPPTKPSKGIMPKLQGLGSLFRSPRGKSPVKVKENLVAAPEIETGAFDETSSESAPLSHLTVQRPKNPQKRPPSKVFLENMAVVQNAPMPSLLTTNASPKVPQKAVPILPVKPSKSPIPSAKTNGKPSTNDSKDEFVRREEFDKLAAAFEAFRLEATNQIKELEKRVAAVGDRS